MGFKIKFITKIHYNIIKMQNQVNQESNSWSDITSINHAKPVSKDCKCCTCDPCSCDPCECCQCCSCDPCTCDPCQCCQCCAEPKTQPKKGGCGCGDKKKNVEQPKKGGCCGDKKTQPKNTAKPISKDCQRCSCDPCNCDPCECCNCCSCDPCTCDPCNCCQCCAEPKTQPKNTAKPISKDCQCCSCDPCKCDPCECCNCCGCDPCTCDPCQCCQCCAEPKTQPKKVEKKGGCCGDKKKVEKK